jgi:hypothetical protein
MKANEASKRFIGGSFGLGDCRQHGWQTTKTKSERAINKPFQINIIQVLDQECEVFKQAR